MVTLIGLCGKPHSGKTEVRYILQRSFGFRTINKNMPLVRACSELTGLSDIHFQDQNLKNDIYKGIPKRKLMGQVGNLIEELYGENYFLELAILEQYQNTSGNAVIESLRKTQTTNFPGIVIEIISNRSMDFGNSFDDYDKQDIKYQLYNNGSLAELEQAVGTMLDDLRIRTI